MSLCLVVLDIQGTGLKFSRSRLSNPAWAIFPRHCGIVGIGISCSFDYLLPADAYASSLGYTAQHVVHWCRGRRTLPHTLKGRTSHSCGSTRCTRGNRNLPPASRSRIPHSRYRVCSIDPTTCMLLAALTSHKNLQEHSHVKMV